MELNHKSATKSIVDFKAFAEKHLKDLYNHNEVLTLINYILEDFLNLHRPDPNQVITLKQWEIIASVIRRLAKGEPYQYITGRQLFAGLWIKVCPSVLIPRPETEELFELVKNDRITKGLRPKVIIDHCTGSGCLAIALKKTFSDAFVLATDISGEALEVAAENANLHAAEVQFHKIDLLTEPFVPSQPVDLIVSNPPYVSPDEAKKMHINVLKYEPHLALFVPKNDPLIFYRRILDSARDYLSPMGLIALEINPNYANELSIQASLHYTVELKKDISGKLRFLFAFKPLSKI